MNKLGKRFEELWLMLPSSLSWALLEILVNLHTRIRKLESAPTPELQQSETPSSVAIETPAETSTGSTIYWSQSFHVKAGGNLRSYLGQGILDWLSSLKPLGVPQEVEIGVTLHSKAVTPPDGSRSPSTREPILEGNGPAGEWRAFRSSLVGPYVCRVTTEDTPSTPCFYMVNEESARDLKQLLNRAVLSDLPLEVS